MVGTTLSHFRITAKLGEGGMGEVYRAEDTKLGREVAIKVLPQAFTSDPERLARFEREARVLASLSHPSIAGIHEVGEENGTHFLVMELASGETLAERLVRGAIPADEARRIALQIAEALEAAHEEGIVHRDLKPSNVKVSEDGQVKVLDFGLAKALGADSASAEVSDVSLSPTLTFQPSMAGVILGTAAYMSPEQARGHRTDKRADIWAFGVVLWEMLTGRKLFDGESVSDILAAVLRASPPEDALPKGLPEQLRRLLDRCLERDPKQRLRDIGEARITLAADPAREDAEARRASGYGLGAVLAVALAAAVASVSLMWAVYPDSDPDPARGRATVGFSIRLPAGLDLEQGAPTRAPMEVAPDGSFVVFSARRPGEEPRVFRRGLDSIEIVPVAGAEGGREPFVSPDSRWIGFYTEDGGLAKVPAEGGLAQRILDGVRLMPFGAHWASDDRIFFSRGLTGGIAAVSAAGGERETLTTPDSEAGEIGHWQPQLLPGGRELLFGAWTVTGWRHNVLDLQTGDLRRLDIAGASPRYLEGGHLFWLQGKDLIAAPFDLLSGRVLGEARTLLGDVSHYDLAGDGTLAYLTRWSGLPMGNPTRWSRTDGQLAALEAAGPAAQIRIAPEGRRLAVSTSLHLWILELDRGVRSRFTTDGAINNFPVWSPDGRRLLFNSIRDPHGLYDRPADGVGETRLVLARKGDLVHLPASWSPDGRGVAVTELDPDGRADVVVIDVESGVHTPMAATEAVEHSPSFSPDGRWLAYVSDVSGRDEVYVRPYPDEGRRITISTEGGGDPRWSPEGSHLLYRKGPIVYEVSIGVGRPHGATLEPSPPRRLTELDSFHEPIIPYAPTWDVAPNGDLLYVRTPSDSVEAPEIFVIHGWARELLSPRS